MKVDLTQLITAADKAEAALAADKAKAQMVAAAYLSETDWMVIRAAETSKPVPDDVRKARAVARAKL